MTFCAIVSDNISPTVLARITEKCGMYVYTQDQIEAMEQDHYDNVILPYIQAQKAAGQIPSLAIKQNVLEIHGAQHQPDGTVRAAIAINLAILFSLPSVRTDLETGLNYEGVNRYARAGVNIAPNYKSGKAHTFYPAAATYAAELAKNPKVQFSPNGSVILLAGSGLTQKRVIFKGDQSYVIFSIYESEVEIADGKSYQIKDFDCRNAITMSKTGSSNVIDASEFDFDDVMEDAQGTPTTTPMVLPAAATERRVPQVGAPTKPVAAPMATTAPVTTRRTSSPFPIG
jgi:hypothetical protein